METAVFHTSTCDQGGICLLYKAVHKGRRKVTPDQIWARLHLVGCSVPKKKKFAHRKGSHRVTPDQNPGQTTSSGLQCAKQNVCTENLANCVQSTVSPKPELEPSAIILNHNI